MIPPAAHSSRQAEFVILLHTHREARADPFVQRMCLDQMLARRSDTNKMLMQHGYADNMLLQTSNRHAKVPTRNFNVWARIPSKKSWAAQNPLQDIVNGGKP